MNALAKIADVETLPSMVDRAARALAGAKSAAEVLEANALAGVIYDTAKRAARLAKAKGAHDTLVAAAHRAQADALEIEAQAKRRIADEYDAAQDRGEIPKHGGVRQVSQSETCSATDLIPPKELHEAREIRDAEEADPGIVRRTLNDAIESGEEPTRAKVKRAVRAKSKRKRKPKLAPAAQTESQHDRDLRMLLGVWEAACESARAEFLTTITN